MASFSRLQLRHKILIECDNIFVARLRTFHGIPVENPCAKQNWHIRKNSLLLQQTFTLFKLLTNNKTSQKTTFF